MLPIPESVFDRLQESLREQVSAVSLTKASLVHLSHCAEGLILKHRLPAMLFTGFQESSHWRKETQRYRELANITKQITIFAGGKLPPESNTKLLQVTLANDDPMRQEWVLLILSDELSLVLVGQDARQPAKQEAERLFDVLWTFQPQAVQSALNSLEGLIERYVPEKLPLLQTARQEYHIGPPNPDLASEFVMDLLHFESRLSHQLNYEQSANRAKTFLMRLISHEFRTPLSTILSSAEILDRYEERLAPQERHHRLETIRQQVHRMNTLLEDILANLQSIGSALPLRIRPVDLIQTTQAILATVETSRVSQSRVRFEAPYTTLEATLDSQVYDLILSNLLSNALKYSQGQVVLQLRLHEGQVSLTVQDHGLGIPANQVDQLFKPFFRAANVGQIEGLGLGLALVGEAVQRVGGRIEVDSAEGLGTTVRVTLPIHWQEEA